MDEIDNEERAEEAYDDELATADEYESYRQAYFKTFGHYPEDEDEGEVVIR